MWALGCGLRGGERTKHFLAYARLSLEMRKGSVEGKSITQKGAVIDNFSIFHSRGREEQGRGGDLGNISFSIEFSHISACEGHGGTKNPLNHNGKVKVFRISFSYYDSTLINYTCGAFRFVFF